MDASLARSVEALERHVACGDWDVADRELQYMTGVFLRARLQGRDVVGLATALADMRMRVMTENDVTQEIGPAQFGWMLASVCSVAVQAGEGAAARDTGHADRGGAAGILDGAIRRATLEGAYRLRVALHQGRDRHSIEADLRGTVEHLHGGDLAQGQAILWELAGRAGLSAADGGRGTMRVDGTDLPVAVTVDGDRREAVVTLRARDGHVDWDALGVERIDHWRRAVASRNGLCVIGGQFGPTRTEAFDMSVSSRDHGRTRIAMADDPTPFDRDATVRQGKAAEAFVSLLRADPDVVAVRDMGHMATHDIVRIADTGHLVIGATMPVGLSVAEVVQYLLRSGMSLSDLRWSLRGVLVRRRLGPADVPARPVVSECVHFTTPEEVDAAVALCAGRQVPDDEPMPWPTMAEGMLGCVVAGTVAMADLEDHDAGAVRKVAARTGVALP